MRKIVQVVIGVLIFILIDTINVKAEYDDAPYLSVEYLNFYLENNNIEVYNFKDYKKVEKFVSKCKEEPVFIEVVKKLGKKPYYARTKKSTDLVYIGQMKSNKPDGIGSILQPIELIRDPEGSEATYIRKYSGYSEEIYYARVYIGNFKNGMAEGYGIEFSSPAADGDNDVSQGINLGGYYEQKGEDVQNAIFETTNPRAYEGGFKNGQHSGKGNEYIYNVTYYGTERDDYSEMGDLLEYFEGSQDKTAKVQELLSGTNKDITVYSGDYKKGKKNGQFKVYELGYISYKGDMKSDKQTGEGTIYYPLLEQIQYKGELTGGMYQGQGTLYNEDGSINYKGEWENGDYAQ